MITEMAVGKTLDEALKISRNDVAEEILTSKTAVNIFYASTRDIKGKAYGQMIVQIPGGEVDYKRVVNYLNNVEINYEEMGKDDIG